MGAGDVRGSRAKRIGIDTKKVRKHASRNDAIFTSEDVLALCDEIERLNKLSTGLGARVLSWKFYTEVLEAEVTVDELKAYVEGGEHGSPARQLSHAILARNHDIQTFLNTFIAARIKRATKRYG